jgi:hypothetical protein
MIADEVQAALAVQRVQVPVTAPRPKTKGKSKTEHYGNATQRFQAVLTEDQKAEMRRKRADGAKVKALIQEYGISRATYFRYMNES